MAFLSMSMNGEGDERVELGFDYNPNNLSLRGLFFQGNITREQQAFIRYTYDTGSGVLTGTFGPFQAKNTQTGRIVNLANLGLDMREVEIPPGDPPDPDDPPPGTLIIKPPAELISFSVEWL